MGNANRLVGYLASVTSASLFYMVWFVVQGWTPAGGVTVSFWVVFAFFFWLFEGMAVAFVLMVIPWYLTLVWQDRLRRFGPMYFSLIGAAATVVLGCGTSSLSWKPLFIEDQTFLEGYIIAFQRQGICLLLSGFVFGLTFWLVSERTRYSPCTEAS